MARFILRSLQTGFLSALLFAPPMHAQIVHSAGPLPSFEVATVKPNDPKVMVRITPPGLENVVGTVGTAKRLISTAYNASLQRVDNGPDWIDDQKTTYMVEGKIPEDLYAQMQRMTAAERHNQAILMMQSLLADRFKLKVHFEMREMPVYELTIAKDGAKLPAPNDTTPAAAAPGSTAPPRPPQMGGGEQVTQDGLRVRNMTLDGMLTAPWFGLGGRPILNKTGLTGTYNLTLHDWHPDIPAQGPNGLAPPPDGQASIFTVLQEQLGLKLTPGKASMEVVVIDHIERPSEN
jgi:bla regulator protein blaR1